MAEGGPGGDFPSLRDGSDADFDFKCTPCGEDNIREEAVKYCPDCHEHLCSTCTRHHGRLKATRSHKLLDPDAAKHGPVVVTRCLYHPDRDIEMYCRTHDMVYCTMCVATVHRSCSGVNRIEDEQHIIKANEIHMLVDQTQTVNKRMKSLSEKIKTNIESLEEQKEEIQQNILEVERNIIEHARKLKSELLQSLQENYTKAKNELESEIDATANTIHDIENTEKQLQTIDKAYPREKLVQTKLAKKVIADANVIYRRSESNGTKVLNFTENAELLNSVTTATALGQVDLRSTESRQLAPTTAYKMKSMEKINVRMSNDTKICRISDVCQLEDGTVLLTDLHNKRLKRLDANYNVKDCCDLDNSPTGICVTGYSKVAVKLANNTVQFISVGADLSQTRRISITSSGNWGITYFAGELWVSRYCGVNVYSTTGTLIKSLESDQNGRHIFKRPLISDMAVSDDTVIVTDQGDGAVCLNRDGTVLRQLRDGRLKQACGVCVTDDGTVFISGLSSDNIVMFSSDGRCLGELVSGNSGLNEPINLCYDRIKHCIIVACHAENHIVQLSK